MPIYILVADDDSVLQNLMCDILKKQGYIPLKANNGQEALDIFFSRSDIALCILDVMMPIYDGFEVMKEIREYSDVKILMLTALGDEAHEIKGLCRGADDYIAKPFSYPVLIARIDSLLRKIKADTSQLIQEQELTINRQLYRVTLNGETVELNNKEYQLLLYLIENKKIVLTREKILDKIWGFDYDGDIRTIDAHIKMLRKKLGDYGNHIKTIRSIGYKFEADI